MFSSSGLGGGLMHRIQAAGTIGVQSHTRAFHFGADSKEKIYPSMIIAN
ncbi:MULTISPECIES: hypothetical protein [unclassified Paraburkholderia]|nr:MULTISPECIES: hypothetical protein [unclassified Paraburkholderia]